MESSAEVTEVENSNPKLTASTSGNVFPVHTHRPKYSGTKLLVCKFTFYLSMGIM